jgi:predicted DNA-binding transcriptional regulator AlpA
MAKTRGAALTTLPPTLNPDQRLTAVQAMALTGRGRSKFYKDVRDGNLPAPSERDGHFVRWRAGDLLDAMSRREAA